MIAVALFAAVMSQDVCNAALIEARARAMAFDTDGAIARLRAGANAGCDVEVALAFLQGLAAGRTAATRGGDEPSLQPLRTQIAAIERRAVAASPDSIAALVLRAAAAAAQSELGELLAYISQALQEERARGARGLQGAPIISAHEVAGELWLEVHRYDDAVAAFRTARGASGDTPRLTAGLARALVRQRSTRDACLEYRRLVADPDAGRPSMAGARAEAQRVLAQPDCQATVAR
jgi:hypothetical protein